MKLSRAKRKAVVTAYALEPLPPSRRLVHCAQLIGMSLARFMDILENDPALHERMRAAALAAEDQAFAHLRDQARTDPKARACLERLAPKFGRSVESL